MHWSDYTQISHDEVCEVWKFPYNLLASYLYLFSMLQTMDCYYNYIIVIMYWLSLQFVINEVRGLRGRWVCQVGYQHLEAIVTHFWRGYCPRMVAIDCGDNPTVTWRSGWLLALLFSLFANSLVGATTKVKRARVTLRYSLIVILPVFKRTLRHFFALFQIAPTTLCRAHRTHVSSSMSSSHHNTISIDVVKIYISS